jgi:hypothetical protein
MRVCRVPGVPARSWAPTVTMYVSNGRFFHRFCKLKAVDGALSVYSALHRLTPLQPFCTVEPHGC